MWTHEHVIETDVAPAAIWQVLRDIDSWAAWDTSLEEIKIHGPFAVGTEISMTPKGQDAIRSTITTVQENEVYADETRLDNVILRFSHTLARLASGGTQVRHRPEITGPTADQVGPELGPAITEDFPEAMDALIARAQEV